MAPSHNYPLTSLTISTILIFSTLTLTFSIPTKRTVISSSSASRALHSYTKLFRKNCLAKETLTCYLNPTAGNIVTGLVTFKPVFRGYSGFRCRCLVRVIARVSNLTPGKHGFHVHTYGDIRFSNGTSTGGHFTNPWGTPINHGLPFQRPRHMGDLGNLVANEKGEAVYNRVDRVVTLSGIRGRAIIVHALEDQGKVEQPTGAAGARQASCVIGFENPDL